MKLIHRMTGFITTVSLLIGVTAPLLQVKVSANEETMKANTIHDYVFTEMAMGSISAEGYLKTQLELQKEGLTGKLEELSPSLKNNAWFGGTGDAWERGPYYVRGLVALAYTLNDADLKKQAQKWIDWTLNSQTDSGFFGPTNSDLWARILMLQAIKDYGEATGDKRVMPFFDRYLRYELKTLLQTPIDSGSWTAQRIGDNVEIVSWYYAKTKASWAIDLIKLLYRQGTDWESVYQTGDFKRTPMISHIVNQQQSFKLLPLAYLAGCGETLKDIYEQGIATFDRLSGRADGSNNGDEYMRDNSSVAGSETCSIVERMLSDEIVLRALGDASIADHLERLAFNAMPTTTNEDMTAQTYFNLLNQVEVTVGYHDFTSDGGDRLLYGVPGGYPCCIHNFSMGWPKYVSSMWAKTANNGVAALVYGPSSVTTTVGKDQIPLTVTEKTSYPFQESISFEMTLQQPQTFDFVVRIPQWCSSPTIAINGVPFTGNLVAGSYVTLNQQWKSGDVVSVSLPMQIQLINGENNSVSVQRGPLVYALQIQEQWKKLDDDYDEQLVQGPDGNKKPIIDYAVRKDFPSSNDPQFASYEVLGKSPWNYALILNTENLEESLTFQAQTGVMPDQPFSSENAPVAIQAKAQRLDTWTMDTQKNVPAAVPQSPVTSNSATENVTLVPMGCARLRVTCLPWSGSGSVKLKPTSATNNSTTFAGVSAADTFVLTYHNQTNQDINAMMYINGCAKKEVVFSKDKSMLILCSLQLSEKCNNSITFRYESNVTGGVVMESLSALTQQDNVICLEAEDGQVHDAVVTDNTPSASQSKFVGSIDHVDSGVTWDHVWSDKACMYTARVFYATGMAPAYHTLRVNGQDSYRVNYTMGTNWSEFGAEQYVKVSIALAEGYNTIELFKPDQEASYAQVDRVELEKQSGASYEAEDAVLTNCRIFDAPTASGGKYVADINDVNAGMTFEKIEVETAGYYRMTARYATGMAPAWHSIIVNDKPSSVMQYQNGTNWGEFKDSQTVSAMVELKAGTNTLSLIKTDKDASFVQIDRIDLTFVGSEILLEAEDATTDARLTLSDSASGGKYIGGIDNPGQFIDFAPEIPAAGDYQIRFFYATPQAASHTVYQPKQSADDALHQNKRLGHV